MYTNGFTGQKFCSLVKVTHFDGTPADLPVDGCKHLELSLLTTREFAERSEHVTLETIGNLEVTWANLSTVAEHVFTGI